MTGEPLSKVIRAAFTRSFVAAFVYFALAAVLLANLIDGSLRGYLLATVVALLSVTLTETLAGQPGREDAGPGQDTALLRALAARMGQAALENLLAGLRGEPPEHTVNPEVAGSREDRWLRTDV